MSTIQQRVVSRYIEAKDETAMIVRPVGEDKPWGWTLQSVMRERRLHLVPMDPVGRRRAKVFLADEWGYRCVSIEGDDNWGDAKSVAAWASQGSNRAALEERWVDALLSAGFVGIDHLTRELVIHGGHALERRVSLEHGVLESLVSYRIDEHAKVVGRRVPLRALIWEDEDADIPF